MFNLGSTPGAPITNSIIIIMETNLCGIVFEDRIVTLELKRFTQEVSKIGNIPVTILEQNPHIIDKHFNLYLNQKIKESPNDYVTTILTKHKNEM